MDFTILAVVLLIGVGVPIRNKLTVPKQRFAIGTVNLFGKHYQELCCLTRKWFVALAKVSFEST